MKKAISFHSLMLLAAMQLALPVAVLCATECSGKASPNRQVIAAHACCEEKGETIHQLKPPASCICAVQPAPPVQEEAKWNRAAAANERSNHPSDDVSWPGFHAPQKLSVPTFVSYQPASPTEVFLKNTVLRI